MSLRPSARTESRRNQYKVSVDAEEGRRRREDNMVEIRKNRREESLQKRRREGSLSVQQQQQNQQANSQVKFRVDEPVQTSFNLQVCVKRKEKKKKRERNEKFASRFRRSEIVAKKMEGKGTCGIALMLMLTFIAASGAAESSSSEASFIKKTIKSHKIVIFSKSYCPYCKRAKAVFEELNVVPYVVELNERDDGSSIQDALSEIVGRRTVPQVFIDGEHLGGSDDTVEAFQSGELAKLLGIASEDADNDDDL